MDVYSRLIQPYCSPSNRSEDLLVGTNRITKNADAMSELFDAAVVYRYSPSPHRVYMNITNRCSNSCSFCIKNLSTGLSGYRLWLEKEPSINAIWIAFRAEVKNTDEEVVWCGFGEPTIRLSDVLAVTRRIKEEYSHLKIRLDTDGLAQLRNKETEVARDLKNSGLESVSISLNAHNEEKYVELCRPSLPGSYQAVLDFARDCRTYLSQVRLTVVDIDGVDIAECRRIAESLGCGFAVRG